MGRSVHLSNFCRDDGMFPSELMALEAKRLQRPVVENLRLSGGYGRVIRTYSGLVASLGINGKVPEIPHIEDLDDTGWVFRQVWNLGTSCPIIVFDIPDESEKFLERLLMFYIMLYGD